MSSFFVIMTSPLRHKAHFLLVFILNLFYANYNFKITFTLGLGPFFLETKNLKFFANFEKFLEKKPEICLSQGYILSQSVQITVTHTHTTTQKKRIKISKNSFY